MKFIKREQGLHADEKQEGTEAANQHTSNFPFNPKELFQFMNQRKYASLLALVPLLLCSASEAGAATEYVNVNNPAPSAPYTNWATAATRIQDAVDAASPGDLILVADGVYQTGGLVVYGAMSNRVAVTKPVTLLSVNGPGTTLILGQQMPGTIIGYAAMRCVYLTNGAVLSGFTLINGATLTSGDPYRERSGGGVWCESSSAVVSNCVILQNSANSLGGGAYSGTLNNCKLINNSASAYVGDDYCYGGGAYASTLNNCILTGNHAGWGGGSYNGTLNNCTVSGNTARRYGGGVSASSGLPIIRNCIVYDNSVIIAGYAANPNIYAATASYCCTTPLPDAGTGNFTNAPLFVDQPGGNLHLQPTSPCINAGLNATVSGATDLDGNPRIRGGTVDVGAYEFQNPTSLLSYAWLQQYGFPTDGSADFTDPDGDGLNNWQEWIAGTNPTDAASLLRMLTPTNAVSGITITWQSVPSRNYYLQRASNLASPSPFQSIQNNLVGQAGTTSCTDTNATGPGPFFYRVGVQ